MGAFDPRGVNPQLVWNVRNALDAKGFSDVRIVVSGGFDPDKIRRFEAEHVPVDSYGVGSSLFRGQDQFHRRRGERRWLAAVENRTHPPSQLTPRACELICECRNVRR